MGGESSQMHRSCVLVAHDLASHMKERILFVFLSRLTSMAILCPQYGYYSPYTISTWANTLVIIEGRSRTASPLAIETRKPAMAG